MATEQILALDFGAKSVGVAATDGLGLTVVTLPTIFRERETKLRRTLSAIERIIEERGIRRIVLGLPLHMDGREGERSAKTREFADMLRQRTGLPVEFQDERLTTEEALDILKTTGQDGAGRLDSVAAAVILEDYLSDTRPPED
ncbi:MAG: Holliday junction resolvase RuvX [Lachnospiraceae bacterium]|nr:Holliday junction resolvase RuvX [Lachnospiraceae bacterium]